MPQQNVTIPTPDGTCPAAVFTPATGAGPWPAVIFYMDAIAIRPVLWGMGQRLADAGYLVLLPDLFYRDGPYAPKNPMDIFTNPAARESMMKSVMSLTPARKIADTGAFLAYLASNPHVKGQKYGATGYCMGGNWALTAAGAYPDKFAAAASYHGGGLATDAPDSPHLALKNTQARIYVAGAVEDEHFDDAQKALLEKTLTEGNIPHLVETYDAKHGFTMTDLPVYDEAAAERHWTTMLSLFSETLPA
jgi:carboxymethylenebutenolidase